MVERMSRNYGHDCSIGDASAIVVDDGEPSHRSSSVEFRAPDQV